jgi:hypothetical protein
VSPYDDIGSRGEQRSSSSAGEYELPEQGRFASVAVVRAETTWLRSPAIGDLLFAAFVITFGALSLRLIPYDFTDLCYLFSLEQGRWVTQEWVHPIWVPSLALLAKVLAVFGYRGRMLVPVELFNIALMSIALAVLYRLARTFPGAAVAGAVAIAVAGFTPGFWSAAVRPTPYAAAVLCQAVALSLLITDRPTPPRRYAAAGCFSGLAMGFHASAMALGVVGVACAMWGPDAPEARPRRWRRIAAFATGMAGAAAACWLAFMLYYRIGLDYFRNQDFAALFAGIEQTPRTSLYTNQSIAEQWATFVDTFTFQLGVPLGRAAIILAAALLLRLVRRAPQSDRERRLSLATLANFAAVSAFFVINGTRNGFIFAALTLVPAWVAVSIRDSWIAVAALAAVMLPGTAAHVQYVLANDQHGPNDPLLREVQFLQHTLAARDIVLTPGSPFPELFYLSHLNVLEVAAEEPTHPGTDSPVVRPTSVLRDRIGWWLAHGSRVFYAVGDRATDFVGDVSGAEKGRQIFWRPETAASQRGAALDAMRAALEGIGLSFGDEITSPNGERYALVQVADAGTNGAPPEHKDALTPRELHALFQRAAAGGAASPLPVRAQFLVDYEAAVPGDPWLACDVMRLVCQGYPSRDGTPIRCEPIRGCDAIARADQRPGGVIGGCFWAAADKEPVDTYLRGWADAHGVGPLEDWGFTAADNAAELTLATSRGPLTVKWELLDTCAPTRITVASDSLPAIAPSDIRALLDQLPVPKAHPGGARRS